VEDIGYEDLKLLEESTIQMFGVIKKAAEFSCKYVKRSRSGRLSSLGIRPTVMAAERMKDAFIDSKNSETINGLVKELAKIHNTFMYVINVESLRLARRKGRHSLCLSYLILSYFA
jgi:hypothetical protein